MIFGKRAAKLSLLLIILAIRAAGAENGEEFRALMRAFASVPESRVSYEETKSMSVLDSPIRQTGVLTYVAPSTVIREIDSPVDETYAVVDDVMDVTRGGSVRRVELESSPLLLAFVESFRATLSGDWERLERFYYIDFSGDGQEWALRLRPRNRALAQFVELISFAGSDAQVHRVRIDEPNGDWSQMVLTPVDGVSRQGADVP